MLEINFIINEINNGKSLKQISLNLGKSAGYISNYLKTKNISLPNIETVKNNRIKKCIESVIKPLNLQFILQNINAGLSSKQIGEKYNCSNVHIKKWVKKNIPNLYTTLIQNGCIRRNTSAVGRVNKKWRSNKGKTYEEIYGADRAKDMRNKRSLWLRKNNIRKFATKISKPQAMLFAIVKKYFSTAEIEFEVMVKKDKKIFLDIAIPDKKICIEYDGIYWHEKNEPTIAMKDKERDNYLFSIGWKVFRIRSHKNLNEKELNIEFHKLNLLDE